MKEGPEKKLSKKEWLEQQVDLLTIQKEDLKTQLSEVTGRLNAATLIYDYFMQEEQHDGQEGTDTGGRAEESGEPEAGDAGGSDKDS